MTAETWDLIVASFWPMLSAALGATIPLALASFVLGLLIAVGVSLVAGLIAGALGGFIFYMFIKMAIFHKQ